MTCWAKVEAMQQPHLLSLCPGLILTRTHFTHTPLAYQRVNHNPEPLQTHKVLFVSPDRERKPYITFVVN